MAGEVGIEPTNAGIRIQCLTTWRLPIITNYYLASSLWNAGPISTPQNYSINPYYMAGEVGIEPTNAEIKTQCLNRLATPHNLKLTSSSKILHRMSV